MIIQRLTCRALPLAQGERSRSALRQHCWRHTRRRGRSSLRADIALAYDFRPAAGFGAHEVREALVRHRVVLRALAQQALLKLRLRGNATDVAMNAGNEVPGQRRRTEETVPARHLEARRAGFSERRQLGPGLRALC